jgi:hypothetical protein
MILLAISRKQSRMAEERIKVCAGEGSDVSGAG